MSPPASGWTVETLHEHLIALIEAQDRRHEARTDAAKEAVSVAMAAADRAVLKAEAAAERRFEGVNEFRATLADQQRNLIPRVEVDVLIRGVLQQVGTLEKNLDGSIKERQTQIAAIQRTLDTWMAEKRGVAGGWGYAAGLIGVLLAIVGLASRFWGP